MVCATEGMGSTGKDHSTNGRFWERSGRGIRDHLLRWIDALTPPRQLRNRNPESPNRPYAPQRASALRFSVFQKGPFAEQTLMTAEWT